MPSVPKHILIVEDDPGLAMLFGDKLRHAGYTCAAVDSAKTCLAWLATQSSDLMLLDYSLPDLLAPALVERLRHAGRLPPFIVVTGHGDERVAVEMMKLGARDYLVKDNLLFDRMPAVVDRTLREVEKEQRLAASEAALKQSESLYHDLVETSQDLIWQCDTEGRYTYLNPVWEQVFGYTIEEMLGRKLSDFQHPEVAARDQEIFARLLQGGVLHGHETVHLGKTGHEIHLVFNAKHLPAVSGAAGGARGTAFDITERKRAEAALRQSEERLRITLETTHIGIWDWDLTKDEWVASSTYFTMLGYPPVTGPASRSEWLDRLHPEDRALVSARIADVLQGTSNKYEYEARTRRADGTYCWQQVRGDVVARDPSGRATRLVGTRTDITERKHAEQDLEQFFALVPDMVCIASGDGFFRRLNDEWVRVLGYSKEELMAVPFIEFIHPEDRAATRHESAQQAAGNSTASFVNRYRAKDGTYRWLEWNATATNSKGILFAAARDITKHRQAEEALRESEEKFAKIFHDAPVWIAITDMADATYLDVNEAVLHAAGFTREEVIGHTAAGIGWIRPEDRTRLVETIREHGRIVSLEMAFHTKDGRILQGLVSGEPISIGGRPRLLTVTIDITARKRAEDDRLRSHELLAKLAAQVPGVVYQYRLFPDGRSGFPYASPGMQDIYEYAPEDVRADATPVFGRLHPEDAGFVSAAILESARTLAPFHCEFRVVLPRQGLRWRLSDAMPERTEDGGTLWYGIISDITDRRRAEAALHESLHEKEALLKEVHHRVKNNLQVISSLLRLEAGRVADPGTESVLRDMQNRIRTMALLHESLYRSGNLAEVDMRAYLETLCQQLFRAASARSSGTVELQVAVGPIRLELNRTVPCGLIVNELVSNCLKHAFPAGRGGRVRVELLPTPVPDEWGLRVGDNGVGLPAGFTLAHLPSLGLQLVSDLARQLQGRLEIAPPPAPPAGTVVTVYLKAPPPESRPAP